EAGDRRRAQHGPSAEPAPGRALLMIVRGSRYESVRAFDPDPVLGEVFASVRPRDLGPATSALEHVVRAGDRLDLLAAQYYGDPRLGFRILDANPELLAGDAA